MDAMPRKARKSKSGAKSESSHEVPLYLQRRFGRNTCITECQAQLVVAPQERGPLRIRTANPPKAAVMAIINNLKREQQKSGHTKKMAATEDSSSSSNSDVNNSNKNSDNKDSNCLDSSSDNSSSSDSDSSSSSDSDNSSSSDDSSSSSDDSNSSSDSDSSTSDEETKDANPTEKAVKNTTVAPESKRTRTERALRRLSDSSSSDDSDHDDDRKDVKPSRKVLKKTKKSFRIIAPARTWNLSSDSEDEDKENVDPKKSPLVMCIATKQPCQRKATRPKTFAPPRRQNAKNVPASQKQEDSNINKSSKIDSIVKQCKEAPNSRKRKAEPTDEATASKKVVLENLLPIPKGSLNFASVSNNNASKVKQWQPAKTTVARAKATTATILLERQPHKTSTTTATAPLKDATPLKTAAATTATVTVLEETKPQSEAAARAAAAAILKGSNFQTKTTSSNVVDRTFKRPVRLLGARPKNGLSNNNSSTGQKDRVLMPPPPPPRAGNDVLGDILGQMGGGARNNPNAVARRQQIYIGFGGHEISDSQDTSWLDQMQRLHPLSEYEMSLFPFSPQRNGV